MMYDRTGVASPHVSRAVNEVGRGDVLVLPDQCGGIAAIMDRSQNNNDDHHDISTGGCLLM
jgi:hypothetical protein